MIAALLLATSLIAQDQTNLEKFNRLLIIRDNIEAIDKLKFYNIDVDKDGSITKELLRQANEISGGKVNNFEELHRITGAKNKPPTPFEQFKGWLTFVNIVWITGAFLIVAACVWLFGLYFLALILAVPAKVWEVILYGACLFLIALGSQVPPAYFLAVTLPGCLGLLGCLSLTSHIRESENTEAAAWFLSLIWGAAAIFYGSHVIGFLAIMAILSAFGFTAGHFPGVLYFGFEKEAYIPRATIAAGMILAFYVFSYIFGIVMGPLVVFNEGMVFMGSFVYFLGVLILSSKWYCIGWWRSSDQNWPLYWLMQVVCIASGVVAIYLGSVYQVGFLLGIGGTLFYIYLLEKYYELPWRGAGWAWSLLGLGGILYAFAHFAQNHPEYFLFTR